MSAAVSEMLAQLEAEVHALREVVAEPPADEHAARVHRGCCNDAASHVATMLSRARSLRAMFEREAAHNAVAAPKLINSQPRAPR